MSIRKIFRISLLRPRDVVRDVDEEISFHIAMREERLRARGLSDDEAARLARSRFGNLAGIRNRCLDESEHAARRDRFELFLSELRRDGSFALRSLRRAKAFTAAVTLTLALGIGANATMFAIINAVVLHPVSGVRDPATLFEVGEAVSYPDYHDIAERVPSIALGAISERRMAIGRGQAADHTDGALVSGNLFRVAGVSAAIGRTLEPRDDVAGADPVAVLTHDYWSRSLGGDSSIVGRTVSVNGSPVVVVGVAAPAFRGLHLGVVPSIWLPIHAWAVIAPSSQKSLSLDSRNWGWLRLVGRVPRGMTADAVQRSLITPMSALDPAASPSVVAQRARPRFAQAAALPRGGRQAVIGFLGVLTAVVTLVLLTACANIAGLMLSRAAYREREIGVRIALGAGRARLMRQLLTESLVLAALGGGAGLVLFAALRGLLRRVRLPGGVDAGAIQLDADWRLIAFAIGITVVTGICVGLVPALHASHGDALSLLKGGSARGPRRQRLRGALVSTQVAVALVLLLGTGLFTRALARAFALDIGFRPDPLVTLSADPGLAQLDSPRAAEYYKTLMQRVSSVPGVRGATLTTNTPLSGDEDRESAKFLGYTPSASERVMLERNTVGPRYHEVVGIPMVAGRGFDDRDDDAHPPVVIINETAAKRYFAGRSAVDGYVSLGKKTFRIIGVARDTKYHELNESPRPYVYLAMLQMSGAGVIASPTLVARVDGDAARLLQPIVEAARGTDPAVPIYAAATMSQRLRGILAPQLAGAWLLGAFGALALIVASVGIYGIVAYAVSQRTREIGIRMALGARRSSVLGLLVRGNVAFVALGIPMGLAAGLLLARAMKSFLFGVGAADPVTFVAASLVITIVGLAASAIPARRATRIDPLIALRADT